MRARPLLVIAALATIVAGADKASAYPEFQKFIQASSGRAVNCAMCHVNPDGPEGTGPGQVGSLGPEELQRLNRARGAFEPGQQVDNPVLNPFGNKIIGTVGKRQFLELKSHPADLAGALGDASDLDGDGISDAREYLDGTLPLDRMNGSPLRLFANNLRRNAFHVVMIVVATALAVYGLASLLRGTHAAHAAMSARDE